MRAFFFGPVVNYPGHISISIDWLCRLKSRVLVIDTDIYYFLPMYTVSQCLFTAGCI